MNANLSLSHARVDNYTFTVFPDDLNYAGTLFGGKLLAEMDLAASNSARRMLYDSDCNGLVTAKLGEVNFLHPAYLGDIITLETRITQAGRSSVSVEVKAGSESIKGEQKLICTAHFVMVALKEGRPHPHHKTISHE